MAAPQESLFHSVSRRASITDEMAERRARTKAPRQRCTNRYSFIRELLLSMISLTEDRKCRLTFCSSAKSRDTSARPPSRQRISRSNKASRRRTSPVSRSIEASRRRVSSEEPAPGEGGKSSMGSDMAKRTNGAETAAARKRRADRSPRPDKGTKRRQDGHFKPTAESRIAANCEKHADLIRGSDVQKPPELHDVTSKAGTSVQHPRLISVPSQSLLVGQSL